MSILRKFLGKQDNMPSVYNAQSVQDTINQQIASGRPLNATPGLLGQYQPNSIPTPTPATSRAKTQLTIEPVANGYIVRVVRQSDTLATYVATDADSLSNVVNLALVSHKVSEALK